MAFYLNNGTWPNVDPPQQMSAHLPKLIAFDLEYALHYKINIADYSIFFRSYTLWDLWIDTHVTGTPAGAACRPRFHSEPFASHSTLLHL
jgi:hypothetical protein